MHLRAKMINKCAPSALGPFPGRSPRVRPPWRSARSRPWSGAEGWSSWSRSDCLFFWIITNFTSARSFHEHICLRTFETKLKRWDQAMCTAGFYACTQDAKLTGLIFLFSLCIHMFHRTHGRRLLCGRVLAGRAFLDEARVHSSGSCLHWGIEGGRAEGWLAEGKILEWNPLQSCKYILKIRIQMLNDDDDLSYEVRRSQKIFFIFEELLTHFCLSFLCTKKFLLGFASISFLSSSTGAMISWGSSGCTWEYESSDKSQTHFEQGNCDFVNEISTILPLMLWQIWNVCYREISN